MKFYERFIKVLIYSVAACLLLSMFQKLYKKLNKRTFQMKFILLWTSNKTVPFSYLSEGRSIFIKNKCPHTNCYVTSNRSLLNNYTLFDVIAFSGTDLDEQNVPFPTSRLPHQKYIFASTNSSVYHPLCRYHLSGYFNWTWTYKLDSDIRWGIVVRDKNNNIIGPNKVMHWIPWEDMKPVNEEILKNLTTKLRPVAWDPSECNTDSKREALVKELEIELKENYGYDIDVYGKCGSKSIENRDVIDRYYFYLCFEDALSEDYVTDSLLIALEHNTVPIVYGGANYTRFMPDGMYLDAKKLGITNLAKQIDKMIKDPELYAEYFKWRNHYKYHRTVDAVDTNEYCKMCDILNDDKKIKEKTVYYNFKYWWNELDDCD